jgi:hypothetical protein
MFNMTGKGIAWVAIVLIGTNSFSTDQTQTVQGGNMPTAPVCGATALSHEAAAQPSAAVLRIDMGR